MRKVEFWKVEMLWRWNWNVEWNANGGILSILLIPVMIGSRFTVQRLRMMDTAPNNNQNLISSSYLIG